MLQNNDVCMPPLWIRRVLIIAGVYNLVWGLLVIGFPKAWFELSGMDAPNYPQIWQCVGMIVGVYGIGYLIAASDPFRHWSIVLVGLLGKVLGPIGFTLAATRGELPWVWGWTILTNDLIWWFPFIATLYLAFKSHSDTSAESRLLSEIVTLFESQRGATISGLSAEQPLLLLFVRHFGCTFCREALSDLAAVRGTIEQTGTQLAVVHMSSPMGATLTLAEYGLDDLHRFSDPTCELYRAFGLTRGSIWQLFGASVWRRGLSAMWRGHGLGVLAGDGFRMPGVFLIRKGRIVAAHRHRTAADRPNYLSFAHEMTSNCNATQGQPISHEAGLAL